MFHEKKSNRKRKSLIVHHPKNTPILELELPKNYPKMPKPLPSITVFLFVDVSFSPKKYPVAP